jgi:hypothetical protein
MDESYTDLISRTGRTSSIIRHCLRVFRILQYALFDECLSQRGTDSELDGRFIGVCGYMIMRGLRGSSPNVLSTTQHRCMPAPCTAVRLALHVTQHHAW